jgi:hypothetical protein
MTGQSHKASLKPNKQQPESEADDRAAYTLETRSSAYVPQAELIPAQEESGDKESRYGSCRAQGDLRQLARKPRTKGRSQGEKERADQKEK